MDAVDSGASVGFLPPLPGVEAQSYRRSVVAALQEGTRVLLAARVKPTGCVTLWATPGSARFPATLRNADATLHTTVFFYKKLD